MIAFSVIPPRPLYFSRELFFQTFLSASPPFDQSAPFSVERLLDQFIGLMRLPYLTLEIQKVHQMLQQGKPLFQSPKLLYQLLSVTASTAEVLLWAYQHHWIVLTVHSARRFQRTCYLARMILYKQAVDAESAAFLQYRALAYKHPQLKLDQKKEYQLLKLQFCAHLAYLSRVTIELISSLSGATLSRSFLNFLHFTSFFTGLLERAYDNNEEWRKNFAFLLPKKNIYGKV